MAEQVVSGRSPSGRATLDQRLRFIDLTMECVERATGIHERIHGKQPKAFDVELPSPRSIEIGRIAARLREKAAAREGLPIDELLGREPVSFRRAA